MDDMNTVCCNFPPHFITPLVYDESLSYYEFLCLLNKKMNEVIALVGTYVTQDELTASQDAQTAQLEKYVDDKIQYIKDYADSLDKVQSDALMYEVARLEKLIDESKKETGSIFDPTRGFEAQTGEVVNRIYHWLRYRALTAMDFDVLGLTAGYLDVKGYTAKEYDLYSDDIFRVQWDYQNFNPFTGRISGFYEMVNDLCNLHRSDDLTAQNSDAKDRTAHFIDGLEITAFKTDWGF